MAERVSFDYNTKDGEEWCVTADVYPGEKATHMDPGFGPEAEILSINMIRDDSICPVHDEDVPSLDWVRMRGAAILRAAETHEARQDA